MVVVCRKKTIYEIEFFDPYLTGRRHDENIQRNNFKQK